MARHESKWAFLLEHFWPSLAGLVRLLFSQPSWALSLLGHRIRYFFSRQLVMPIPTPDGFVIESGYELVTYWSQYVERECWDEEWIRVLDKEPKPLVLDVGANAGLFTHLVWHRRPEAQFLVFEPLPRMARKITAWKEHKQANLVLHQVAVSNHCGTAEFFASEENDPTASLRPEGEKSIRLTVPTVTLDSVVLEHPVLMIKIDVEGCECDVLKGAEKTLQRTRFLIVEAHTKKALNEIEQQLGPSWRSRRLGASDYLFQRK